MTKYVQTNDRGYVTGIVEEPLLLGLLGGDIGRKPIEVSDDEAVAIETVLKAQNRLGEGMSLSRLEECIARVREK